jgi:hypothetical protein
MKIVSKISLVAFMLALGACTKLDLEPRSSTTPSVLFQEESSYRSFLAKIYAGLAVTGQSGPAGSSDITSLDEGFSNYIRQYWQLQELSTDEAVIAWGDEGLPDLHNHTWTSANQFIRAVYYRVFFQVSMANEFLRESTDDKLDARGVSAATRADVATYRAEARFMRALSLWHGIDLFGAIPFYTEENTVGSELPRQASRQEVFTFIERELNEIENAMIPAGQQEYGRASRAALWMLQAKLYLNAEVYTGTAKWNEAATAAKKVIDSGAFSLTEDYLDNFLADNNTSPEIIFAVPSDGINTRTWGNTTYLVHAAIGGGMDAEQFGVNDGWSGLRTTRTFVEKFPDPTGATDERALFYTDGQTLDIESISTFSNGYALPKYRNLTKDGQPGSHNTHPDTDFPMFRLADAYLIYAEAVLRGATSGDLGTALGYVNALRERAHNDASGNITQDQLTLDFILDERARELYWEAHRRTDLIRFDQFSENGVWPWKGGVKEGRTTESFRDLYPIPISEILANPNLTQNPGY